MNNKTRKLFVSEVQKVLNGKPLEENHEWAWMYDHSINTNFGEYVYSIDPEDSVLSVMGRFTNEEKRKSLTSRRMNPINGKFNFHFFESDGTMGELAGQIKKELGI